MSVEDRHHGFDDSDWRLAKIKEAEGKLQGSSVEQIKAFKTLRLYGHPGSQQYHDVTEALDSLECEAHAREEAQKFEARRPRRFERLVEKSINKHLAQILRRKNFNLL